MNGIEDVRRRILESQLLSPEALDRELAEWRLEAPGSDDGQGLISWLVAGQLLTEFQVAALQAGHSGPLMLGPYRVRERIAAGRLGNVFRAVHADMEQPVSLKIFPSSLRDDPEKLARMGREVRVAIQFDHPHVVRSFHAGQVGDNYFLSFEDLPGESLESRLEREPQLPFGEACRLIRQAALGLEYLHEHEVVHRDVRPGTLWITDNGTVKVMEFGSAIDALSSLDAGADGEELTSADAVLGSYDYMAPEQAQDAREADPRSDIYALGCTLFRALAGRPPFVGSNPVRQMLRHANEPPPAVTEFAPDVPPALAETVASMLGKQPEDRFQRASDVAWALEQFVPPEGLAEAAPAPVQDEFLAWARSELGPETAPKAVASPTPELVEFLDWLMYDYEEES